MDAARKTTRKLCEHSPLYFSSAAGCWGGATTRAVVMEQVGITRRKKVTGEGGGAISSKVFCPPRRGALKPARQARRRPITGPTTLQPGSTLSLPSPLTLRLPLLRLPPLPRPPPPEHSNIAVPPPTRACLYPHHVSSGSAKSLIYTAETTSPGLCYCCCCCLPSTPPIHPPLSPTTPVSRSQAQPVDCTADTPRRPWLTRRLQQAFTWLSQKQTCGM